MVTIEDWSTDSRPTARGDWCSTAHRAGISSDRLENEAVSEAMGSGSQSLTSHIAIDCFGSIAFAMK